MDSITIALVVFVFFSVMVMYFVSTPITPPPPPQPTSAQIPAILKKNIAVARLMRLEHKGTNQA